MEYVHKYVISEKVMLQTSTRQWVGYLHWDVDEFDKVADESHDSKANGNCSTNLDEL